MVNKVDLEYVKKYEKIKTKRFYLMSMAHIAAMMSFYFIIMYNWPILTGFYVYILFIAAFSQFLMMRLSMGGRIIVSPLITCYEVNGPESYPVLWKAVVKIANLAELDSIPRVYVISNNINAVVADQEDGQTLCVGKNLLDELDQNETEALVAHEVAHLKHKDVDKAHRLNILAGMLRIATIFSVFVFLSFMVHGAISGIFYFIIVILIIFLIQDIIRIPVNYYIQSQEFLADLTAAYNVGNAEYMAGCLKKIDILSRPYFYDGAKLSKLQKLLLTHPTIDERIKVLENSMLKK